MIWHQWTPTNDVPCQFSRDVASANARFLSELVPQLIGLSGARRRTHPILTRWDSGGPGVFVLLNSLAEDAKLLLGKPGFHAVLRDLHDERGAMAAWHTLHVAALIERARPCSVIRFFDDNSQQNSYFLARLESRELPVEAKLLTRSEVEKGFREQAMQCAEKVTRMLKDNGSCREFQILMSDALEWPSEEDVLNTIAALGDTDYLWRKYERWGVRTKALPEGQRAVYFLAPLHDKGYLRIKRPPALRPRSSGLPVRSMRPAC